MNQASVAAEYREITKAAQGQAILIVDDSPVQVELLRRLIDKAGYRVLVARDGAQALVMARDCHPAALVSDVNMPVMDGYELCHRIREDPQLRDTPVILLTMLSDTVDVIRGLNAGADSYVTKPYREQYLLRCLASLLATPPVHDEAPIEMSVEVDGGEYQVSAGGRQVINLLVSTYSTAVQQNRELSLLKDELSNTARDLEQVNGQLEYRVAERTAQLKRAFMSTVGVTTVLSGMRDPYTAGHARRVGDIAAYIGGTIGLDGNRQEGLRVAGLLHDVGKITVPTEILSKPGKLTALEFELIKGHSKASYEVLKDVEFPWPVAEIALQHHERMDGSGYPQGLKGDAIMLEACIMAVSDVVEAMSSHRPYRPGLGLDKALAEIERGRGTLYHPLVADACLKLFRVQGYVIPV